MRNTGVQLSTDLQVSPTNVYKSKSKSKNKNKNKLLEHPTLHNTLPFVQTHVSVVLQPVNAKMKQIGTKHSYVTLAIFEICHEQDHGLVVAKWV